MGVLRPVVPLVFKVTAAVPSTVSVELGITAPVVIVPVPGIPGTNGSAGAAGSQGVQGIQGVKGDPGVQGIAGTQGTTGAQGTAGTSLDIKGAVATYANLPSLTSADDGDAYIVVADGFLYFWDGTAWPSDGSGVPFEGPQGTQGVQGIQGTTGDTGSAGTQGVQGLQGSILNSWQGSWSSATTYSAGAIVKRLGSTYLAVGSSTGVDPHQDLTSTVAASAVGSSIALGSPNSIGFEFQVDQNIECGALDVSGMFNTTPPGGSVGIASAVNVTGVGTDWIEQGDPSSGKVTFINTVSLSANTSYWLVINSSSSNLTVTAYANLTYTHMSFPGGLVYGSSGNLPAQLDGYYGVPIRIFGAVPGAWDLFAGTGS